MGQAKGDIRFPFAATFERLTDHSPMPWQGRLHERLMRGDWPDAVDLPTGLGKTSVIVVWLIALLNGGPVPRRLIACVNRRTIIDQHTDTVNALVERIGENGDIADRLNELAGGPPADGSPLAVSTLRGERADNERWQDPARPAVVLATPDLAGSALLFSAYRSSWKRHAFLAGLMGQDVLLLHDEAHLSRPFQALLERVAELQADLQPEADHAPPNLRVLPLSATQIGEAGDVFALEEADREDDVVRERLDAVKTLRLHEADDVTKDMIARALAFDGDPVRVIVYVRSPLDAGGIHRALKDKVGEGRVALLTGTIRGMERDELAESEIFRRLRGEDVGPLADAVYLVSTSAGEVGADLDADHLVCDLAPADALVQRLGRVNRRGANHAGGAEVHVVAPKNLDTKDTLYEPMKRTADLLRGRGADGEAGIPAGPLAVRDWVDEHTASPTPRVKPLKPGELSALTFTSLGKARKDWTLLPDVPTLIHGIAGTGSRRRRYAAVAARSFSTCAQQPTSRLDAVLLEATSTDTHKSAGPRTAHRPEPTGSPSLSLIDRAMIARAKLAEKAEVTRQSPLEATRTLSTSAGRLAAVLQDVATANTAG